MHTTTADASTRLATGLLVGWWTTGDRALVRMTDGRHLTVPVPDDFDGDLVPGSRFLVELDHGVPVGLRVGR